MEWINVKDRLPTENQKSILVYDSYKYIVSIAIFKRDEENMPLPMPWYTMHDDILHNYTVTHWQPLPEPPDTTS